MSQNGAQEMAREGKNYEEILMFFYDGVEIRDCEEDQIQKMATLKGHGQDSSPNDKSV